METVVKVGGMKCGGCVKSVTGVLSELPDVRKVEVSLEQNEARVEHGAGCSLNAIRAVIEDAGFDAL
jgi:copper chaperone